MGVLSIVAKLFQEKCQKQLFAKYLTRDIYSPYNYTVIFRLLENLQRLLHVATDFVFFLRVKRACMHACNKICIDVYIILAMVLPCTHWVKLAGVYFIGSRDIMLPEVSSVPTISWKLLGQFQSPRTELWEDLLFMVGTMF